MFILHIYESSTFNFGKYFNRKDLSHPVQQFWRFFPPMCGFSCYLTFIFPGIKVFLLSLDSVHFSVQHVDEVKRSMHFETSDSFCSFRSAFLGDWDLGESRGILRPVRH